MNIMKARISYYIWLILMMIIAFSMTYPFIFSLLGGLMTSEDFGDSLGILLPIPKIPLYWKNVNRVFTLSGLQPLINTVLRTTWYTGLICLMAFMIGYVMARYEFRMKKIFFIIIICSQLIPGVLTLIPTFVMAARIPFLGGNNWLGQGGRGLINNTAMLYLPLTWNSLIWVFLMMQSIKGFPRDFEEAAEIDGGSFLYTLFKIVLPLQLPILTVIAVSVALGTWNDWLTPFLYINNPFKSTLSAWVAQLTSNLQEFGKRDYPLVLGLGTVTTIPPFLIFLFFQKYIIQGIASAGIKG